MAIATKLFTFRDDKQGWFLETAYNNLAFNWVQWEGVPYGCLGLTVTAPQNTGNGNGSGLVVNPVNDVGGIGSDSGNGSGQYQAVAAPAVIIWQGTWQDMGVPSGQVVSRLSFTSGYTRIAGKGCYWTAMGVGINHDLQRTYQQDLVHFGHNPPIDGFDLDWVQIGGGQFDWQVPAQYSAYNQKIYLLSAENVAAGGNDPDALPQGSVFLDEFQFNVIYSDPSSTSPGIYTGIASLYAQHPILKQPAYYSPPSGRVVQGESQAAYKDCIDVIPRTVLRHVGANPPIMDTVRGTIDLRQKRGAILFADLANITPGVNSTLYFHIRRIVDGTTVHVGGYSQKVDLPSPFSLDVNTEGQSGQSRVGVNYSESLNPLVPGDLIAFSGYQAFEINRVQSITANFVNLYYPLRYNHILNEQIYSKAVSLKPIRIPGGSIYEVIFNYPSNNRSAWDRVIVRCMAQIYEGDVTV